MSLPSLVEALRKEFVTLGIPDILEMAVLSSSGKVLHSDLGRTAMSRVSPFYNNLLMMGLGDNLSLAMDPTKTIVASKVSNRAIIIALTDKKVGIVLNKMTAISDKFGRLLDEVIALEESKNQTTTVAPEAPVAEVPIPSQPEPVAEAVQPPSPSISQPEPVVETALPPPQPEVTEEPGAPIPQPQPPTAPSTPASAIVDVATSIIDDARARSVTLRAVGGVAVAIHCPSARYGSLAREYPDIDLVGHAKDDTAIKKLISAGFEPIKRFNALHGRKRLKFFDEKSGIGIDIYFDLFEMCHKLDFKDRLEFDEYTIPLADLLMSKLQIVNLNEKDVRDTTAIMKDHDLGSGDPEKIDIDYIAKLCSDEWGLYKTLSMNAEKISKAVADYHLPDEDTQNIKSRLAAFLKRLEDEPKSAKWRKRAAIGEKAQWYETVE